MSNSKIEPIVILENYRPDGELKSVLQYVKPDKDKKKCLIPRWALVLSISGFLFISLILLAALFGVYFAPRQAMYQESCESRSCVKDLNLKCINKTCLCETGYIYIGKCTLKKNYLEKCHLDAICKDNKYMKCLDGLCKCDDYSYWNGSQCVSKSTYQQPCTSSNQCLTLQFLYCDTTSKKCICDTNTRFWDKTSCFPKRTYNERCNEDSECKSSEHLYCLSGTCKYFQYIV
jgi:hypothetical protein